jgi:hypothetical protein
MVLVGLLLEEDGIPDGFPDIGMSGSLDECESVEHRFGVNEKIYFTRFLEIEFWK